MKPAIAKPTCIVCDKQFRPSHHRQSRFCDRCKAKLSEKERAARLTRWHMYKKYPGAPKFEGIPSSDPQFCKVPGCRYPADEDYDGYCGEPHRRRYEIGETALKR